MRKFKHKPTGEIFTEKNSLEMIGLKDSESDGLILPTWLLEQGDDWEEVKEEGFTVKKMIEFDKKHVPHLMKKEPNYLITAFNNIVTGDTIKHDTQLKDMYCYIDGKSPFYDKADLLNNNQWIVSKVKNNKGEEFCIGDDIKGDGEYFKIASFEFADYICGGCYVCGKVNGNTHKLALKLATKVKSPIYTTTDKVDIQEGEGRWLWLLSKDFLNKKEQQIFCFSKQDKEVADRYLTFTSEENRDKYIKENSKKPIMMLADGKELFEGDTIYHFYKPFEFIMHKSILRHNTIYGDVVFYKEESAKEYIDNNKPKYSFVDILNAYDNTCSWASFMDEIKKLGK